MSTFQGEVTQASRGRIRDTSNSRKIHFGAGWLHLIIKGDNRKPGFSVAAPRLWNKLPFEIRACSDVNLFKSKLKTFLFTKVYDI